jgi:hypothetical protein
MPKEMGHYRTSNFYANRDFDTGLQPNGAAVAGVGFQRGARLA